MNAAESLDVAGTGGGEAADGSADALGLGGHPKPANGGHLKTGQ
jgi:hypothetical protein